MSVSRLLTHKEFRSFFNEPMRNVTEDPDALVDIWAYVDALDLDTLSLLRLNDVHYVYRDATGRYDEVLIGTGRFNTLLAVIVDRERCDIAGHYLLDLNQEYGESGGHLRVVE